MGNAKLSKMEQLIGFVEFERKANPGATHIADWALSEIERLQTTLLNRELADTKHPAKDSLSSELDRGDTAAHALVEHVKRMGAANMRRVVDGFKVSVEHEPADDDGSTFHGRTSVLGNPAGTPGAKVDASRLTDAHVKLTPEQKAGNPPRMRLAVTPEGMAGFVVCDATADLPPPHDSQEEAQRAAGIWPQEAEPATVRAKPSALPTHQICVKRGGSHRVGDMVAGAWHVIPEGNWAPCDKDGWIRAGTTYATQPGLHFEFDQARNAWRPGLPPQAESKPSALDEMAAQAASWRVGVDLARDGADAMAYMLRGLKPAPTPVDFKNHQWIGIAIDHATKWRTAGGMQNLLMARHYLDKLIELEGKVL